MNWPPAPSPQNTPTSYRFLNGAPPLLSDQFRSLSALLEIRLYDAAVFWQFRNAQNAEFMTVPGFQMPRAMNLYGVRWNFLN